MHKHPIALALLSATLLASCSDNDGPTTPTEPAFVGRQTMTFGIHPSTLSSQLVGNPFCPAFPPFLLPFDLTVAAGGGFNLSLIQLRLQFVDTFGVQMPQVTLPQPALTTQFGSTLIAARSTRTFPLSFRFGCGTARAGTLIVIIDTRDDRGQMTTTKVTAAVR